MIHVQSQPRDVRLGRIQPHTYFEVSEIFQHNTTFHWPVIICCTSETQVLTWRSPCRKSWPNGCQRCIFFRLVGQPPHPHGLANGQLPVLGEDDRMMCQVTARCKPIAHLDSDKSTRHIERASDAVWFGEQHLECNKKHSGNSTRTCQTCVKLEIKIVHGWSSMLEMEAKDRQWPHDYRKVSECFFDVSLQKNYQCLVPKKQHPLYQIKNSEPPPIRPRNLLYAKFTHVRILN